MTERDIKEECVMPECNKKKKCMITEFCIKCMCDAIAWQKIVCVSYNVTKIKFLHYTRTNVVGVTQICPEN